MKGLYVIYEKLDDKGVNRKIISQIKSFEHYGIEMESFLMENKKMPFFQLLARLPFSNVIPCYQVPKNLNDFSFIYLRRPGFMSYQFLKWLKSIKAQNQEIIIFMEIPTYPYDIELLKKKKNIPFYLKDVLARRKLSGLLDYICLLEDIPSIFNVKTLKIYNGYEFEKIPIKYERKVKNKEINIAVVARFCFWHGYERLLNSLADYYKNNDEYAIYLHFVGDGPELESYKQLTRKLNIQNHVFFYGFLNHDEIIGVYEKCVIASDAMGAYKKNIYFSCSLKSREYLAAGLPIITGIHIDVQNNDVLNKYILEFSNDNTKINMKTIIDFYERLFENNDINKVSNEIRNEACRLLDYRKSMKNVVYSMGVSHD